MAVYAWEGRLRGRTQRGQMEAPSKSAVITRLRQMQIQPIPDRIKEKGKFSFSFLSRGVSSKQLVVFTRQLSTMIDAGLPLVQSLDVLAAQQKAKFKSVLTQVKESVESGSTFADAIARHPRVFDHLFVNLVRAGEAGGVLDTVLQRLSTFLEKIENIKRRIKGAMVYPAVVIAVATIVVSIILIFVVPTFASLFKDLGTGLPAITQFIVDLSAFLKSNIIYILIALAILSFAIVSSYRRSARARKILDAFLLKLWLVGDLTLKTVLSRFCRTLATLTTGGIPILDGLEITAKASGNMVTEEAILEVRKGVSEGKTLAEPLSAKPKIFPPMLVQMIAVGEQTGALDDMLNKVADFYDEEVDVAVASLLSALEPVMIALLGGTVGFIVIAMYMPMFKMISTLSK